MTPNFADRYLVLKAPEHIEAFDKRLTIFYNKSYPGLHSFLPTNKDLIDYISRNLEDSFQIAILKDDVNHYCLNIAIPEDSGTFRDSDYIWAKNSSVGIDALKIYSPIISKFLQECFQCTISDWTFQQIDYFYFKSLNHAKETTSLVSNSTIGQSHSSTVSPRATYQYNNSIEERSSKFGGGVGCGSVVVLAILITRFIEWLLQ